MSFLGKYNLLPFILPKTDGVIKEKTKENFSLLISLIKTFDDTIEIEQWSLNNNVFSYEQITMSFQF